MSGRTGRANGIRIGAWLALMIGLLAGPAEARNWARNPMSQAQDYATITDNRGAGELVLLMWLAPPMVPPGPAREVLDRYVVISAVHAHAAPNGGLDFERAPGLQAFDAAGKPLTALSGTALPPALVEALAPVQGNVVHGFGSLGQGMQWFIFEAGPVHACAKGEGPVSLSVPLAGETYTFATPFPGC